MGIGSTLIAYRGAEVPLARIHGIALELLGGHLRPDAELVVHASSPVRVDRTARSRQDPLAGTVRCVHLAVPRDCDGLLTDLSRIVLRGRLGFPDSVAEAAVDAFGLLPTDAIALKMSEDTGPVATLTVSNDAPITGSYSVFSGGRRLWTSCYRPGASYCTWDGTDLQVDQLDEVSPSPPEGDFTDFAPHGLSLLFGKPLELSPRETANLIQTLWRATRPPTAGIGSMVLVEDGRFVPPGRDLHESDWNRLIGSLGE